MTSTNLNRKDISIESCFECDGRMERTVLSDYDLPQTPTKPAITIHDVECFQCTKCGEAAMNPVQIKAMEAKAIERYREILGLLSQRDIDAVATHFKQRGISRDLLEKVLKFNPRSFYRWINNLSIQSDQADSILRLIRRHPEALFELAEEIGISISA